MTQATKQIPDDVRRDHEVASDSEGVCLRCLRCGHETRYAQGHLPGEVLRDVREHRAVCGRNGQSRTGMIE